MVACGTSQHDESGVLGSVSRVTPTLERVARAEAIPGSRERVADRLRRPGPSGPRRGAPASHPIVDGVVLQDASP